MRQNECYATYLQGTKTKKLIIKKNDKQIEIYTDADWASDTTDRKSFSGFVTLFANGTDSWSSKKQPTVALSTLETEFIALGEAMRECLWLNNLLRELNQDQWCAEPITIHIDNQGAMKLAEKHVASESTKHLDLRKIFVQEAIKAEKAKLTYVPTELNLADSLTKGIDSAKLAANLKL